MMGAMTVTSSDPVTYGPATALVVVDVQNDFASPAGSLYVDGGQAIVPLINAEINRARAAGSPVFYTQDWHPESTPHFRTMGGVWPVHCVRDTDGARLHPDLTVAGAVVRKGVGGEDGYSGFTVRDPVSGAVHSTDLVGMVAGSGARALVVTGLAGDHCVRATALDGAELGYDVTVPLGLTRFVNREPGDGARAVAEMRQAGITILSAEPAEPAQPAEPKESPESSTSAN
jgi:nicotinamidase/pyrazinamidase